MQQNVRVTVMLLESIIQGTQIKKLLRNQCMYSDHPEKFRDAFRKYYTRNADEKEAAKSMYSDHPEKFREASKKAYADHPEKSISST